MAMSDSGAFSADEWQVIQEACEQRCRQWLDQSQSDSSLSQQMYCAVRARALGELITRMLAYRQRPRMSVEHKIDAWVDVEHVGDSVATA